jgi:fatty-acyl-CoA synthase
VADVVPDRLALVNGDVRRTWRVYDDRASRIANVLKAHGSGCDSKVALYCYNSNEYLEAQFGAFKVREMQVNVCLYAAPQ